MNLIGKKIFVTGGAGFIGSHLVERLAKTHAVTVYDNFSSHVVTKRQLEDFGVKNVVKGDINDRKKLDATMKGSDVVFHFAVACVRLSLTKETFVHETNATGTLNTLLSAKKANIMKFIYISSSEIYGTATSDKISEAHPVNPTTVYGMSKYMGELYARHFNDHEGVPSVVIRPFNSYGPRSHFDGVYGEVIPRFTIRSLNGLPPVIFGSGEQTRDFTYVTDTVNGIIKAAENDKLTGDVINIARGQEVTVNNLAQAICSECGIGFQPVRHDARPNDVMRHYADITKARKLLNFKAEFSIVEGIKKYIDWVQTTYPNPKPLLRQIPLTNW